MIPRRGEAEAEGARAHRGQHVRGRGEPVHATTCGQAQVLRRHSNGVRPLPDPVLGCPPVTAITKRDVIEVIETVVDAGHPRGAGLLLSSIRKFYNWAAGRDIVETSPCDRIRAADIVDAVTVRDRVLTDAEIRALWRATDGADYPLNPFIRLLLITGARRAEIANMTRDEVDLDAGTWTLRSDRTKTGDGRVLPLPKMAVDLLRDLRYPREMVRP